MYNSTNIINMIKKKKIIQSTPLLRPSNIKIYKFTNGIH